VFVSHVKQTGSSKESSLIRLLVTFLLSRIDCVFAPRSRLIASSIALSGPGAPNPRIQEFDTDCAPSIVHPLLPEAPTKRPFHPFLPLSRRQHSREVERSPATTRPGVQLQPSTLTTPSSPPTSQTWRPTTITEPAPRASRRRARLILALLDKGELNAITIPFLLPMWPCWSRWSRWSRYSGRAWEGGHGHRLSVTFDS